MLTFNTKSRPRRRPHSRTQTPGSPLPAGEPVDDDSVLPEDAAQKGWYDSSMDLRRGLDVTEDVPLDSLPPDPGPGGRSR